ncbi:MAG: hypothetical protein O7H41_11315 [Planctomycetota bacterium]|nr:hypothetical protein [Planctomycetota bacterium]
MTQPPGNHRSTPNGIFLISFTILFLEMAAIRWLNASVTVLAYFNNLILISCFFGLGLGCLLASRRVRLIQAFAPAFFVLVLAVIFLHRHGVMVSYTEDVIFAANKEYYRSSLLQVSLAALFGFFLNVAFFVILGQELGRQLLSVENPLVAYAYDIAGSLVGVLAYSGLAWLGTPPHVWYAVGCSVLLVFIANRRYWLVGSIGFIVVAIIVMRSTYPEAQWSPYYKIEVEPYETPEVRGRGYRIMVDNLRIQDMIDLSPELESTPLGVWLPYYRLPYLFSQPRKVLILGAGAGNEAVMAKMSGAEEVHVVEIDPTIAGLGFDDHPARPYLQKGVKVIVDDARSYIANTDERYDLVVMSALDSHKQIAGMSSLRLESFVYTLESFEQMKRLLAPEGVFCLSLGSTRPWMGERTYWTLTRAFQSEPTLVKPAGSPFDSVSFIYAPDAALARARTAAGSEISFLPPYAKREGVLLSTDDWPHLYLKERRIPMFYIVILGVMVAGSVLLVLGVERSVRRPNLHFFFLGAGFMLLETRSVTQLALLFGATWNVNSVVFASILATILITNHLVLKKWAPSRTLSYALLAATLGLGFFFPFNLLLGLSLPLRLGAAAVVVGLPIAWASFIFSNSFKSETQINRVFGSNLLGVVFGGCLEYFSNVWGLSALYLVALGLYGASAIFAPRRLTTTTG